MKQNTDVTFKNDRRIHFGLAVSDLEKSIKFYQELFKTEPSKVKPDYAKFELDDPSINLALGQTKKPIGDSNRVSHFGIQLKSSEMVREETERFQKLGWITETEEQRTCCYAVQDKVWLTDPDGNKWELFVVTHYDSDKKDDRQSCCEGEQADCCAEASESERQEACCS